ncbi:MAG: radical SAM protein [Nanoarchaeota archaeon]|nr:radical SAM protein [Nanoarchaeota archaeon]
MSTQKENIIDPKKARRRFSSIFAEAIISKVCNWKIEFVSGGYHSYSLDELVFLVKGVYEITGQKQWLNIGSLSKIQLEKFLPFVEGYAGTVECVNWDLRKQVCPSKHLQPILKAFAACEDLGIKKAMTLIIGLGETIDDFKELESFVKEHKIDRITFYALNPHPQTVFTRPPNREYYAEWIKRTKAVFPDLEIVAGAWTDKIEYYKEVLLAGADDITKLPSIRKFNSPELQQLQKDLEPFDFQSNLVSLPDVDWDSLVDELSSKTFSLELKEEIKKKLATYLKQMKRNG